ncbi:MAG: hypothetical protein RMJ53_03410 [Chitinophagales bacterium]|nr:hypothetical protein [Chitinophagales bacterium]
MLLKKSTLFITCIFLALAACKEKAKKAKSYYDSTLKHTTSVTDSILELADVLRSGNKPATKNFLNHHLNTIDSSQAHIHNLGSFEGDTSLNSATLALLQFYKNYLLNHIKPFYDSIPNDSLTREQIEIADSLHRKMLDDEAEYWDNFNNSAKKFSDKYDLNSLQP